jgi:hypothetical protein
LTLPVTLMGGRLGSASATSTAVPGGRSFS